jgi:tetratricopeptide (TPR) repeat protein
MVRTQDNSATKGSDFWSQLPQSTRDLIGYASIIIVVTLVVFAPLFGAEFINWDDTGLVVENPLIRDLSWSNIKAMFDLSSTQHFKHYLPIVLLSYALEFQLAGLNPAVFHTTNVVLHIINCLLLLWLISKLTRNNAIAFVTAMLFAVHPMHVESVAWITERKDMLSTFFFLVSLISYTAYLERSRKPAFLLGSLVAMVLSLLAKAMAVSIPIVLVLIDYLKGRPITAKSLKDKIPFAVMSFIAAITAFTSQYTITEAGIRSGSTDLSMLTLVDRFFVACYNFLFYAVKLVWPADLSLLYQGPNQANGWLPMEYLLAPIILAGLTLALVRLQKKLRQPLLVFGLLFFVMTLLPVVQLIPVGVAAQADRFVYIPSIGLFLVAAMGAEAVYRRLEVHWGRSALVFGGLITVIIGVYAYGARTRSAAWHDSVSLWSAEIEHSDPHPMAYVQRGQALAQAGRHEEALLDYTSAIERDSSLVLAFNNRGNAYARMSNFNLAFLDYNRAIGLDSTYADAYLNRGYAYNVFGDLERALRDINRAAQLNPLSSLPYAYRGRILATLGDTESAIGDFSRAIALDPSSPSLYGERGDMFFKTARFSSAIGDYTMALELGLVNEVILTNRGGALANIGRYDAAIQDFTIALQINPRYVNALRNRGLAYFAKKEYDRAWEHLQQLRQLGIEIDPSVMETLRRELGPVVQ